MNVVQVNIGYDHLLKFMPICVMKVVVEGANNVLVFRSSVLESYHSRRFVSDWFTDIS